MLFTILVGLLGLGIVIFVHETGHFIAAKAAGIEVEAFSLGWGRPLFRYSYGGTEYRLSALPLGGYCKLKGEQALQQAADRNLAAADHEAGSLFSVSPWKRILTYAAGPVSNLLFSILILAILWWTGFSISTYDNRIVLASDYTFLQTTGERNPANLAGLESGDRILAIDGIAIETYRDLQQTVGTRPGKTVPLLYERNGQRRSTSLTPRLNTETGGGVIGVSPWIVPRVASVEPSSPAAAAGVEVGDLIVAADGREIENHLDLIAFLTRHPLRFSLTVSRSGTEHDLRLIPAYNQAGQSQSWNILRGDCRTQPHNKPGPCAGSGYTPVPGNGGNQHPEPRPSLSGNKSAKSGVRTYPDYLHGGSGSELRFQSGLKERLHRPLPLPELFKCGPFCHEPATYTGAGRRPDRLEYL